MCTLHFKNLTHNYIPLYYRHFLLMKWMDYVLEVHGKGLVMSGAYGVPKVGSLYAPCNMYMCVYMR